MSNASLVRVLARAFLTGERAPDAVAARGAQALGHNWPWLGPVARRYVAQFAGQARPRHRDVVRFLLADRGFQKARHRHRGRLGIADWLIGSQPMLPVAAAASWDLPSIDSAGSLAAWLGVGTSELDWFADLNWLARFAPDSRLSHYRYRVLVKRTGGVRLIEAPKDRLKTLQRLILSSILDRIPPHPAAHGFVRARSIRTFAAPHVGRHILLRVDMQDFFPSISATRVQAMFRTAGYPESVADLLGGICTNAVPRAVWREAPTAAEPAELREARALYTRPHLPQGACTSPALANICAWRLDCRLAGLAETCGATYTRYADDLAFSGDAAFERGIGRFASYVAVIAREEGFAVNHRKTRIMRQGARQHLAGLVANQRLNVPRAEFDLLKAILTNCARFGPESQNRKQHPRFRAHLEGRVAFLESINRTKAQRLRAILDRITWE